MFSIHDFIMETLHGMVGKYPDFQVREYALNWYAKGKLTEDDLAIVEQWIIDSHPVIEPVEVEEADSGIIYGNTEVVDGEIVGK